jgi:hypothetical protein
MHTPAHQPCYLSLNRLAQITGKSRITLLLRVKDGKLIPDAALNIGGGRSLPLFLTEQAGPLRQPQPRSRAHPLL